MGYPMTYKRVVERNGLDKNYDHGARSPESQLRHAVSGDLRRLEKDQRDDKSIKAYALVAGVTPAQARKILDAFFEGFQ